MDVLQLCGASLCGISADGSYGDYQNVDELLDASARCKEQADETSIVCDSALERGIKVVGFVSKLKETMVELRRNKFRPSNLKRIVDLLKQDKGELNETVVAAKEMEGMADECVAKSRGIADTMSRTIPQEQQQRSVGQGDGDNDDVVDAIRDAGAEDTALVEEYESDVLEVQDWANAARDMNLLKVVVKGKEVFPGLVDKVAICQSVFQKCKSLCATVAELAEVVKMDAAERSCCYYVKAGLAAIQPMLQIINLSKLITRFAQIARRLVAAILQLIRTVWEKFGIFSREFVAGKKINNWVNSLVQRKILKKGEGDDGAAFADCLDD